MKAPLIMISTDAWSHVEGLGPARVVVYEDQFRDGMLTLRWRDRVKANWKRKTLARKIERDRRGRVTKECVAFAVAAAQKKSLELARDTQTRADVFFASKQWQKVVRQLDELRRMLDLARNEEQYQAVGLFSREVLISVSAAVYDSAKHPPVDGIQPSDTDAKRRLEAFFQTELAGASHEEARALAKAAVKLSAALQHMRTADFRTAAMCAEAARCVTNLVALTFGQQDFFGVTVLPNVELKPAATPSSVVE